MNKINELLEKTLKFDKENIKNVLLSSVKQGYMFLYALGVIDYEKCDKLLKELNNEVTKYDKTKNWEQFYAYCIHIIHKNSLLASNLAFMKSLKSKQKKKNQKISDDDENERNDMSIESIDLSNQKEKEMQKDKKDIDDFSIFVKICVIFISVVFYAVSSFSSPSSPVVVSSPDAQEKGGWKLVGIAKTVYEARILQDLKDPAREKHRCPPEPPSGDAVAEIKVAEWKGENRLFLITRFLNDTKHPACVYIYEKEKIFFEPLNLAELYNKAGFPSFPDFILDIVFGRALSVDEKLRTIVIVREHPGFAYMVRFQERFAEFFRTAKLIVIAVSLAGFAAVMAWGLIKQRKELGFISAPDLIRRNLVFVTAMIIFVFPMPPYGASPAWLLLEKMVRIGDDIAHKIGQIFTKAYIDVRTEAIVRDTLESVKIDKMTVIEKLSTIEEFTAMVNAYCCNAINDITEKDRCNRIASDLINSIRADYDTFKRSIGQSAQITGGRLWHGYNSKMLEKVDRLEAIIKQYRSVMPEACRYEWQAKDEGGLISSLKSHILSMQDEFSRLSKNEDFSEVQQRFEKAKTALREFEKTGGWISTSFTYFVLLTPFLEGQRDDDTGYVAQTLKKRGVSKSFLDGLIHYPMVGALPPFKPIHDFLRKAVFSEGKDEGAVRGLLRSLISKVRSMLPMTGVGYIPGLGKVKNVGIEYGLLWLSYALGVIVLNFMAYAVVVMSFLYRYVFYVKEILKHYYTTPFLIFWAVTGNDGRFGRWVGKTVYLMLYPSVLIIGLVITYFMFELVNVLQNLAVDYILWADADTEGLKNVAVETVKGYALAAIIAASSFILKVYLGWKIIATLAETLADYFDRTIIERTERAVDEFFSIVRSKVA